MRNCFRPLMHHLGSRQEVSGGVGGVPLLRIGLSSGQTFVYVWHVGLHLILMALDGVYVGMLLESYHRPDMIHHNVLHILIVAEINASHHWRCIHSNVVVLLIVACIVVHHLRPLLVHVWIERCRLSQSIILILVLLRVERVRHISGRETST